MNVVNYSVINRQEPLHNGVSETNRRQLLALAGTAVTGMLGGCATFVDGFGNDQTTTGDPPVDTTTHNSRQSPTTDSTTPESQTTESTTTDDSMPEPDSVSISEPTIFTDDIPLPETPTAHSYAVMGTPSDAPTATIYGNWKCPFTQAFVSDMLPDLVEEYVRPGDAAIEFRAVAYHADQPFLGPDAPRATRAGLAAWHTDPANYWDYFAYVFDNQPPESVAWAQPDILTRFGSQSGITPLPQFQQRFQGQTDIDLLETTVRDFDRLGAHAVPRVVTADAVTAPTVDRAATRNQFRRLVDD